MIIDKLNEVLNSVESYTTMYVFCAYIKSNIHDIAHMTIEEVAKDCYTSKGQISKCAKNLGFASYLEFNMIYPKMPRYSLNICRKQLCMLVIRSIILI